VSTGAPGAAETPTAQGAGGRADVAELGVVYLAFGAPYLAMALTSAVSLRATNPTIPVCMLTNVVPTPPPKLRWWDPDLGDTWRWIDGSTQDNRLFKTDVIRHSPYQKTLFLDCDTFVVGDLGRMSVFLDYFDVAMFFVKSPCAVTPDQEVLAERMRFREVPHFNTGVIGFRRNPRTEQFFHTWRARFVAMGIDRDQPAMTEACFESDVRILPVRESWNQGDFWLMGPARRKQALIWHYKSRSWDERLAGLIRRAATWFTDDDRVRAEVDAYIRSRMGWQHRGLISWRIKALAREALGPLSKLPEGKVGAARWRALLEGAPNGRAQHP
jgi:hypothetical protein